MHSEPVLGNEFFNANGERALVTRAVVKGEEEAFLHFTLNAFKDLVEKYGVPRILKELDDDTFWELYGEHRDLKC